MKKSLLIGAFGTALAVSLAQNASAQGTIKIDGLDSSVGVFLGNFSTSAPTSTYIELLGGASAGSLSGVVSSGTGTAIFQLSTAGSGYSAQGGGAALTGSYFNAGFGSITGVGNGGTAFFQLLAWQGSANFASATYQFESTVWSQAIGTAAVVGPPAVPANPATLSIPSTTPLIGLYSSSIPNSNNGIELVAVPEPSSLALAGLGGIGMLMALRRKQA